MSDKQNGPGCSGQMETKLVDLRNALRGWRWSGDGPGFVKFGSAVRYGPTDLQKFVEAGRRSSTTDQGMEA